MHFLDEEYVIGRSDDSGTANHHRAEAAVAFIGNDPQEDVEGQHSLVVFNPDTMIEVDYQEFQELGFQESKLEYYQQLQDLLNSPVDDVKKSVVDHVLYDHNFKLLRRHFQLQLWVDHRQAWERVEFDSTIRESLNLNQVGLRLTRYCFKVVLNPGQTPATCGRP